MILLLSPAARAEDSTFAGAGAVTAYPEPKTTLSAEFGGAWATGNTESFSLAGAVKAAHGFRANRLGLDLAANLGQSVVDLDGDGVLSASERRPHAADADGDGEVEPGEQQGGYVENARHFVAEGRYDRYFGTRNSLYVLAGALTDPFAGYDSRVHGQVGASRILVRGLGTELRGEVGADLAREDYVAGVRPRTAMITAARQLLGISHAFSTGVTFTDQVEIYENVVDPSDVRLLNTGAFSAKLANALSLRLSHTLVFDNVPVEGFRKLDQTTLATFVATLL